MLIAGRKYSQSYQDSILQYLFANIGVTNKFCVEFGFNSDSMIGGSGSNVARLVLDEGWKCLLLDSIFENKAINLHKETLTPDNIIGVFKKYSVPTSFDYISIDVDGIDLWLMEALLKGGYQPRVLSVEYNCNFPLEYSITIRQDTGWNGKDMVYGASLRALNEVANKFDYVLAAVCYRLDLFFVHKTALDVFKIPEDIAQFEKFTGVPLHKAMTKERCQCLIEYPSGNEIQDDLIEKNPQIFRIC